MTARLDYQAQGKQPPRRWRWWEWAVVTLGLIVGALFFVAFGYWLYVASQIQ